MKKTERVRDFDYAHSGIALLLEDPIAESLHARPMHLRPEMVFGMITVVKPGPVVESAISTNAPGNRLVWISAVVAVIAVEIREAVAKIPERQKETDVMPV